MFPSTRRIVCCLTLTALLSIMPPDAGYGAEHSSHRRGNAGHRSTAVHSRRSATQSKRRQRESGGPLSYDAYWRAATSPKPPRTNQDYNRYWEKMQAWQRYHQR
jgi:hypothetical protein